MKCLSVPFQLYQDTVDVYVVTSDKYRERKRERNKSLANTQRFCREAQGVLLGRTTRSRLRRVGLEKMLAIQTKRKVKL